MAQMRDLSTGLVQPLRAHHTFGRMQEQVDSCVDLAAVSRIHAVLEWNGDSWLIRDLSRNGTWLDQEKLKPGESYSLKVGQRIYLGSPQQTPWCIENLNPPHDLLVAHQPEQDDIALNHFHFLPNDETPELALHQSAEDGLWYIENISNSESRPLLHGQQFSCAQQQWSLFLVGHIPATEQMSMRPKQFSDYGFSFSTSLDEENTRLSIESDEAELDFGERSHHYVLLHLARRRAEDALAGLDIESQGWVDTEQLARDMGLDGSHLNILIYRARKQLAEALPTVTGLKQLVERMRGRLRFGGQLFTIAKGAGLTHQLPLAEKT